MKIIVKTELNIADQIVAELTSPSISKRQLAQVVLSEDNFAEIMIEDDVLALLPVVNRMSLLAQTLSAMVHATTPETEIPMLVDCEFDIE